MKVWERQIRQAPKMPEFLVCSMPLFCFLWFTFEYLAGFGLGALNDADEDDLDVYDADFGSARNRLAYDTHADDILSLGGKAKQSKQDGVSHSIVRSSRFF